MASVIIQATPTMPTHTHTLNMSCEEMRSTQPMASVIIIRNVSQQALSMPRWCQLTDRRHAEVCKQKSHVAEGRAHP